MILTLHPNVKITKLSIGTEKAPLLVVDNFITQADKLVKFTTQLKFLRNSPFYPGVRAEAPQDYRQFFLQELQPTLLDFFQIKAKALKFSICHYSLVTTPSSQLKLLQRIPHFDSVGREGLAAVHYLFKKDLGGTSLYRHKKTGFEYIDEDRELEYYRSLENENGSPNMPDSGYINGDTALFDRIAEQKGIFNRLVIYRRNSLHSGSIDKDFIPDDNPLTGRLSINSFIDPD